MNIEYIPGIITIGMAFFLGFIEKPGWKYLLVMAAGIIFMFAFIVLDLSELEKAFDAVTFNSDYQRGVYWFWTIIGALLISFIRLTIKK